MSDLILGVVIGLITMFGLGMSIALSVIPIKDIGSTKTVFFRGIFTSTIIFISLLFFLSETSLSIYHIALSVLISFIGYMALISIFKGLKTGKVGVVYPIANSYVILTVLFSVLFFGESLIAEQAFSIILMILGIILISINLRDIRDSNLLRLSSGIPFALLTCFSWGFMYFILKIPVLVIGPILTALIIELGIVLFSGINMKISGISFKLPGKKTLGFIFLVGLFSSIGAIFFNVGIMFYNVSLIAPIAATSPLVSAFYGRFVYKEKLTGVQWFAILLILVGIISISYF
ncbi:MAG: DMT family transporter [archaeon]|nr:MAG: DMT family transporter [archaeon]